MQNPDDSLQITKEELGRQAVHSLRGYVYQLYQTIASWLELRSNELLLLEVTEDYAKLKDNVVERVQVGETKASGNITLKSEKVTSLIESHWNMQNANPSKKILSTLLTTSGIGKEKNLQFVDGMSGLEYWRVASREGSDVEPIRAALLDSNLSQSLKDSIKNLTAVELREKLIAPINWVCYSDQLTILQESIKESLICLGETFGISPSNASATIDKLLGEIVQRILLEQDKRQLTRADLLCAFEDATRISVPSEQYIRDRALQLLPTNFLGQSLFDVTATTVRQMPKISRLASRSDYIDCLWRESALLGFLWLSGSNGLGKTLVARSVAEKSETEWLFVDLRDCDAKGVRTRLYSARQIIRSGEFGGLILDDYPSEHLTKTCHDLALLCFEAERRNMRVIATSHRQITPEILTSLAKTTKSLVPVPYLTQRDVAEIVVKAGGDADMWAKAIHAFCGLGHPMLVDARVQGLSARGWPIDELVAQFYPPFEGSMEVQAQRDAILLRLTNELPENVRDLLFRLCICTQFDRALVKTIAEASPSVPRAVEAFTLLLGPWIEARGNDNYSVSPLVSKVGSDNLTKDEQIAVRTAIIESLIGRTPFPGEQIFQLFFNAYLISHTVGLFWFTMLVTMTACSSRSNFRRLAERLSPMLFLTKDPELFPADKTLSFTLRIAQSLVAVGTADESANEIFELLAAEYNASEKDQLHSGLYLTCITFSLLERNHALSPRIWLRLLTDYEALRDRCMDLGFEEELRALDATTDLPLTTSQFLCTVQSSSMRTVDELVDLFDQFDKLPIEKRNLFMNGLSDFSDTRRLMVDSAWLNESNAGTLNAQAAVEKYARLAEMANLWERSDLEVDCLCAQILILDEYGLDGEKATNLVNTALEKYPGNDRLLRRKQFILYRQLKHDEALEVFSQIHTKYKTLHSVDITFALRDAGVSAGQTRNFKTAKQYFLEAASVAMEADTRLPMAAGLLADAAICDFTLGNYGDAIDLTQKALNIADKINPAESQQAQYCHAILGNLVSWMQHKRENTKPLNELWPGLCSDQDGQLDSSKSLPEAAPIIRRYMLAEAEFQLGLEPTLWRDLRGSGDTNGCLAQLASSIEFMANSCKRVHVSDFLLELPHYLVLLQLLLETGLTTNLERNASILSLPPLSKEQWTEPLLWPYFKDAAIAFAFCAITQGKSTEIDELCKRLCTNDDTTRFAKFIQTLRGDYSRSDTVSADLVIAQCAAICRKEPEKINASTAFFVTSQIWMWLRESGFKSIVETDLAEFISHLWAKIIQEPQNSLRSASVAIPTITAALNGDERGHARLASLILASRDATDWRLPDDLLAQISDALKATVEEM